MNADEHGLGLRTLRHICTDSVLKTIGCSVACKLVLGGLTSIFTFLNLELLHQRYLVGDGG